MPLSSALTAFSAFLIPVGFGGSAPKRGSASERARRARERKEYQRLLSMGDHLMHDIGVTRTDVEAALFQLDHR
jgi:uncharacterized protein YjiS (DUF1127 family)